MMSVLRIILFLGFLTGTLMTHSLNQTTMTDLYTLFTARIETHNVAYELMINDIPVISQTNEASFSISDYPINPWLINGRNRFRIHILPVETSTTDPTDTKSYEVVISGPLDDGISDNPMAQP